MMFPNIRHAVQPPGQAVCALAIDAEEDFDWLAPEQGTAYSTACMKNIRTLREIVGAYGIVPTYLLTYPVLDDPELVRILRRQLGRGEADLGVQLHSWVNPPFSDAEGFGSSFPGNLDPALEDRKLAALVDKFTACFGFAPRIYRAGRYGLGYQTAQVLEKYGFTIDLSLAPRTSFEAEGGPDYTMHDAEPFWFGETTRVLEVPLCRSIVGWGGAMAPDIYRALSAPTLIRRSMLSILSRLRCAERITLSPEGNDVGAMIRLLRRLYDGGQRVFVLSFHSSSLAIGRNPYVQSKADLHGFYDRLSGILDFMAGWNDLRFVSVAAIPALLEREIV